MTTLSKMFACVTGTRYIVSGQSEGICCLCGQNTKNGFKKKFGNNFTAAADVSSGNIICEFCNPLIERSNELRRSMWILTAASFKKFAKHEAKNIILNLPDEPFFLYLTNTWQKTGWVKMLNMVNISKDSIICICFDYDVHFVEIEIIKRFFEIIEPLRQLKIPKSELTSGKLSMHNLRKLENPRHTQQILQKYAQNPIWRMCVYLNE